MGSSTGCLLDASEVTPEVVADLASRRGVGSLFVRGPVTLPDLRSRTPTSSRDGRVPGARLSRDDSELRGALAVGREAGMDVYVVLENPLVGTPDWSGLLAQDNGGNTAIKTLPDAPPLCPNRPELLRWLADLSAEMVRKYKPTGILLEDVSLGMPEHVETLFLCWCDLCRTRSEELGYDADRIRIGMLGARSKLFEAHPDVAAIEPLGMGQWIEALGYDTGFLDWLNFRADSVSACLYEIRQAVAGVDAGLRVTVLAKAPTVALLAGQRRLDTVRDTTLADVYAPVICGPRAGVLRTLGAHAGLMKTALGLENDEAGLALAAQLHGYVGLPLPSDPAELDGPPSSEVAAASAERELQLALAVSGEVPCWPAIDVGELPAEVVADVAARVAASRSDGLLYVGVPR